MPFHLPRTRRRDLALGAAGLVGLAAWSRRPARSRPLPASSIEIADMTWTEVRDALEAGFRTVVVPSGGLEQNGPHMVIGKHDHLVRWSARRIAMQLGDALVAPVVSYVPEGEYDPPTGHLRFPGTIGVPEAVFGGVLEGIARSLRAGGFTTICFIADHGGSVRSQAETLARLAPEFAAHGVRLIDVSAYYGDAMERCYLHDHGEPDAAIGPHASIADTAELMAVHPQGVHLDRVPDSPAELERLGGSGAPAHASFAHGDALMALKVAAAVAQIKAATGRA